MLLAVAVLGTGAIRERVVFVRVARGYHCTCQMACERDSGVVPDWVQWHGVVEIPRQTVISVCVGKDADVVGKRCVSGAVVSDTVRHARWCVARGIVLMVKCDVRCVMHGIVVV